MTILIGVDIGQRGASSALCVVETKKRDSPHGRESHYVVRHLERLPAGTSYPALADRTAEVASKIAETVKESRHIYVNATGRGETVVDLFCSRVHEARVVAVYFNHGDRRTEADGEIQLGKAYLVARLQTLLQSGCLHLPRIREAEVLTEELLSYELRVDENANERYGAFRVGARDDMVTALGLASQPEPQTSFYG